MSKRTAPEKLRTRRRLLVTSVLALVLIVFSLVAPLLCQHDPVDANLSLANLAPNDE